MSNRRFDEKLIPPGINDQRIVELWQGFDVLVAEFDFTQLLARTSSEMTNDMLPLALAERSLDEFFTFDGLPEEPTKELIDMAFDLHEAKGTDPAILDGLAAIGAKADIEQWYEQTPIGAPHTHQITVYVNEPVYGDEPVLLNERVQRAALKIINATKRWSQDTDFRLGVGFDSAFELCSGATGLAFDQDNFSASPNTDFQTDFRGASGTTAIQFDCLSASANPNTGFANIMQSASATTSLQIQTISMEAA